MTCDSWVSESGRFQQILCVSTRLKRSSAALLIQDHQLFIQAYAFPLTTVFLHRIKISYVRKCFNMGKAALPRMNVGLLSLHLLRSTNTALVFIVNISVKQTFIVFIIISDDNKSGIFSRSSDISSVRWQMSYDELWWVIEYKSPLKATACHSCSLSDELNTNQCVSVWTLRRWRPLGSETALPSMHLCNQCLAAGGGEWITQQRRCSLIDSSDI